MHCDKSVRKEVVSRTDIIDELYNENDGPLRERGAESFPNRASVSPEVSFRWGWGFPYAC